MEEDFDVKVDEEKMSVSNGPNKPLLQRIHKQKIEGKIHN